MSTVTTRDRIIQAVAIAVLVFTALFTAYHLEHPAPWSPLGHVKDQRPAPVQVVPVPDNPTPLNA